MAINWTHTNHVISGEYGVLAADQATLVAGMAVAPVFEASSTLDQNYPGLIGKAKKTDGTTTDTLLGVAIAPKKTGGTNLKIDQIVVPASPYVVLLSKTATGTIGAFRNDTGAAITVSGSAASGSNIQSGTDSTTGLTSLTFDSSFAGVTFNIVFNYTMTALEDEFTFGESYPGWTQLDQLGKTGVLTNGRVATNNFSTTANWYTGAVPKVKCIAGGLFTDSGSGTGFVPTNVNIISLPTYLFPWLVLEIR